ncbi:hypothetical protein LVJ59_17585 [Microbacterium sp. KKR3/1]|uniref:hypothetical protein n=1 Tax=Microbacterium sp. KKR3/1 TaxID=2904241 RepID=UPI001E61D0A0|nr:hypothetical protein [Microbacterium sp. KKR3/1]MCE0510863.1 hypothetical protein [Microbacterium sp. KKR3/1]
MATPTERVISRLIEGGHIEPGEYRVERTYAGFWQRREGAFSWDLVHADTGHHAMVGSQYSVKECADADEWEWFGEGIIPAATPPENREEQNR